MQENKANISSGCCSQPCGIITGKEPQGKNYVNDVLARSKALFCHLSISFDIYSVPAIGI